MNIAKAYYKGFRATTRTPRLWLMIYASNLILGLIVAIPFYHAMDAGAGNSLALNKLLERFNYTVLSDLVANAREAVSAISSQVWTVAIAYYLLSIFFVGGILKVIEERQYKVSLFFKYCGISFFRFLLVNALVLAGHLIWLGIALLVALGANYLVMPSAQTEWLLYYINIGAIGLYLLGAMFFLMVGDYSKFFLHKRKSHNFLKGAWKGLGFSFRHFGKVYTLFVLLIGPLVAFSVLYFWVQARIEMSTAVGLFLLFLLQQAFILIRVGFRIWILGSQFEMYRDDSEKDLEKKEARKARKLEQKAQQEAAPAE